jgi:tRNA(fMet)-specific endonuclease VapC
LNFALDTNIVSRLWKQDPIVEAHLKAVDPSLIAIPAGVLAELHYGKFLNPTRAPKLEILIADLIAAYPVLPFEAGAAEWFGRLKCRLRGNATDDRDLLIASTALAHGHVMVTNNTKHFHRIDELVLRDWTVA